MAENMERDLEAHLTEHKVRARDQELLASYGIVSMRIFLNIVGDQKDLDTVVFTRMLGTEDDPPLVGHLAAVRCAYIDGITKFSP